MPDGVVGIEAEGASCFNICRCVVASNAVIESVKEKQRFRPKSRGIDLCDQVYVLDNSSAVSPFERVAVLKQQTPVFLVDPLPDWASDVLGG